MKKILNIFIVFVFITSVAFSAQNGIQYTKIPYGITQNVLLATEINSQSAVVGQQVEAILLEDFKYNSTIIAPKESIVKGTIVSNKKAKGKEKALTKVRFTTIETPYNNKIPISAIIKTSDLKGVLTNNKENIKNVAFKEEKKIYIPASTVITLYFDQPITLLAQ